MSEQRPHNNFYTHTDIERYLQGKLSPADMHALEKAALQDPFLADAIEGYRNADAPVSRQHLSDIHEQLSQPPAPVKPITGVNKTGWWRIAAGVIAVAGAATVGWLLWKDNGQHKEVAQTVTTEPVKKDTPAASPQQPTNSNTQVTEKTAIASRNEAIFQKRQRAEDEARASAAAKKTAASQLAYERAKAANIPPAPPPPADSLNTQLITASLAARTGVLNKPKAAISSKASGQLAMDMAAPETGTNNRMGTNEIRLSEFKGVVRSDDNSPLGNATITLNGNKTTLADTRKLYPDGAVTDSNGRFRFLAPDTVSRIQVNALGFASKQLNIKPEKPVEILMVPQRQTLSEIVLTSAAPAARNADASLPKKANTILPEGGWRDFYLQLRNATGEANRDTANTATHGNIEVSIQLGTDGMVKKASILRSFNNKYNEPAIEALKKVSGWTENGQKLSNATRRITLVF